MPPKENTIEDDQLMELEEARAASLAESRRADERAAEEATESKSETVAPAEKHFINSGEATLLLAFTGFIEIIQWLLDMVPYAGWILNGGLSLFMGLIFFIWLTGKIAKGAPKKWYKAVYYGAAGGALPIIPGYLGVMIYLILDDHQLLKKAFGKIGETAQKMMQKT